MSESSPAPPTVRTNPKGQSILPSGCRFILWCLAVIIALAAFSFYKFGQQIHAVRKKEAMYMARAIATSIDGFKKDYNTLPLPSGPGLPGADCDTDTSPTHGFTDILAGKEGEAADRQNKRGVDYFEGIKPAKKALPKDTSTVWKNGIYLDETTNHYGVMDAWGTPFRIRIDTNKDAEIANPNPDQTAAGRPVILNNSAIVWSAGKDGDWDTWDDNPMSWD